MAPLWAIAAWSACKLMKKVQPQVFVKTMERLSADRARIIKLWCPKRLLGAKGTILLRLSDIVF